MSTRKRKADEELVALPSDDSEEEEEYVLSTPPFVSSSIYHERYNAYLYSFTRDIKVSMSIIVDVQGCMSVSRRIVS
jgi:hypothetical protein